MCFEFVGIPLSVEVIEVVFGFVPIPLVRGDCGSCVVIPLSEEVIVGVVALSLIPLVRG